MANTQRLGSVWKGRAWDDGEPIPRVTLPDGTLAEAMASLGYGWNATGSVFQKVAIDNSTGGVNVNIVGGAAGGGAVTIADGANVTQGTTTDTSSANTLVGLLKAIKAAVTGTLTANATLSAETTKVIGVTRSADGTGNLITSTTNALDVNIKSGNLTTLPVTNAGTFAVQATEPKDTGRTPITLSIDSYAVAATADTLIATMSSSVTNGALTGSLSSYTVSNGKKFRVQSISVGLHTITGNTTAVNIIVRLRANAGGAAVLASPMQLVTVLGGSAVANGANVGSPLVIPDGWEFAAGTGVGFSVACAGFVTTTAAPKVDITLIGYEY